MDRVQFELGTICFIKGNLSETLSSKTRTSFSENLPGMCGKAVRLMHNWQTDQIYLTGIETQHMFINVIF